jgi:hypothetical protein
MRRGKLKKRILFINNSGAIKKAMNDEKIINFKN